jgi:hypothetical protein
MHAASCGRGSETDQGFAPCNLLLLASIPYRSGMEPDEELPVIYSVIEHEIDTRDTRVERRANAIWLPPGRSNEESNHFIGTCIASVNACLLCVKHCKAHSEGGRNRRRFGQGRRDLDQRRSQGRR